MSFAMPCKAMEFWFFHWFFGPFQRQPLLSFCGFGLVARVPLHVRAITQHSALSGGNVVQPPAPPVLPLQGRLFGGEEQNLRVCLGWTAFALHIDSMLYYPSIFTNIVYPCEFWSLNLTLFFFCIFIF